MDFMDLDKAMAVTREYNAWRHGEPPYDKAGAKFPYPYRDISLALDCLLENSTKDINMADTVKNNEQINNTDYYKLPCGKYLEDFIWFKGLDFATGSALKYLYRAGKKHGEGYDKDHSKCEHYCKFKSKMLNIPYDIILDEVHNLYDEAHAWDGKPYIDEDLT